MHGTNARAARAPPNVMGVARTASAVTIDALWAPTRPDRPSPQGRTLGVSRATFDARNTSSVALAAFGEHGAPAPRHPGTPALGPGTRPRHRPSPVPAL